MTGGVFHASSGAERDTVEFTAKRVAPQDLYRHGARRRWCLENMASFRRRR